MGAGSVLDLLCIMSREGNKGEIMKMAESVAVEAVENKNYDKPKICPDIKDI